MRRTASLELELQHLMRKHALNKDDFKEKKSSEINSSVNNGTIECNTSSCDLESKKSKSNVFVADTATDAIPSNKLESDYTTEPLESSQREHCVKTSAELSDSIAIMINGKNTIDVCNCSNITNNTDSDDYHIHHREGIPNNEKLFHAVNKEHADEQTHIDTVDACKSEQEKSNANEDDASNPNNSSNSCPGSYNEGENISNSSFEDKVHTRKGMTGSRFDPLRTFASIVKSKPVSAKASKQFKATDTINSESTQQCNDEENSISTALMEWIKVWSRCTRPLPSLLLHSQKPYKNITKLAEMFRFLLVIDFEATCSANSINYPNEIIEFPVIVLDTKQLRVVAHFHSYVKPRRNPVLSAFCRTLTGINQADVDKAPYLPKVLEHFNEWLTNVVYPLASTVMASETVSSASDKVHVNGNISTKLCDDCISNSASSRALHDKNQTKEDNCSLVKENNASHSLEHAGKDCVSTNSKLEKMFCVATDGPWDMRHFMHACSVQRDHVEFPELFYHFVNIKKCFSDYFKCKPKKLKSMLSKLMMNFVGRPHCGYDDAVNITRVIAELLARGYKIHKVSHIERNTNYANLDEIENERINKY